MPKAVSSAHKAAFKITLGYLVLGSSWVLLSVHLSVCLSHGRSFAGPVQSLAGLAYVLATGAVMFLILRRYLGRTLSTPIALPREETSEPRGLESRASAPGPARMVPGPARVLVMDDDDAVRTLAVRMLVALGYETEAAPDGNAALEAYQQARKQGRPFDLVILDLTVPGGMGGQETIAKLLEIDPEVRAVVSSGYSDTPVMDSYQDYGFRATLPKPYQLRDLAQVLADLVPTRSG